MKKLELNTNAKKVLIMLYELKFTKKRLAEYLDISTSALNRRIDSNSFLFDEIRKLNKLAKRFDIDVEFRFN